MTKISIAAERLSHARADANLLVARLREDSLTSEGWLTIARQAEALARRARKEAEQTK